MIAEKDRCAQLVGRESARVGNCLRRGVVKEDGKIWCRQHLPSAVKKRREAFFARYRKQIENGPTARLTRTNQALKVAKDALAEFAGGVGCMCQTLGCNADNPHCDASSATAALIRIDEILGRRS